MIAEDGNLLAESERFGKTPQLISTEIDLERLAQERTRMGSFGQSVIRERARLEEFRTIRCPLRLPRDRRLLPQRKYERFPYVPSEAATRDQRCREVYQIQVQGLVKRLQATGIERVVIGVSGGLDSTQALLVSAQAMDLVGRPRSNILALHDAWFRNQPANAGAGAPPDASHRMRGARDRYPAELREDAGRHRASLRERRQDVRRDI